MNSVALRPIKKSTFTPTTVPIPCRYRFFPNQSLPSSYLQFLPKSHCPSPPPPSYPSPAFQHSPHPPPSQPTTQNRQQANPPGRNTTLEPADAVAHPVAVLVRRDGQALDAVGIQPPQRYYNILLFPPIPFHISPCLKGGKPEGYWLR